MLGQVGNLSYMQQMDGVFVRPAREVSGTELGLGSLHLTIWGDPVVGRALMILLRSCGYEARFVSSLSSSEPCSLEDCQLLVLAPTPQLSTEEREALLASLQKSSKSTNVPVLELFTLSEESEKGRTRDKLWYLVPWPCGIEELEQRIEGALSSRYRPRGERAGSAASAP